MVFELKSKWIIIDIEELHKYIKEQKEKEINLDDLLRKLEWNIIIFRKILGINISHNPSICIYSNGRVIDFYNEERLLIKNAVPHLTIEIY